MGSLKFGDVLVFGLNSGDHRPSHHHGGELGALALLVWGKRPIQRGADIAADEFVCL